MVGLTENKATQPSLVGAWAELGKRKLGKGRFVNEKLGKVEIREKGYWGKGKCGKSVIGKREYWEQGIWGRGEFGKSVIWKLGENWKSLGN